MADVSATYAAVKGQRFGVSGTYNNGEPTGDWGECTAIPHKSMELSGTPLVFGNAADMLKNAPDSLYEKGTGFPPRNSYPVWGANAKVGTSDFGHIAQSNGERSGNLFQSLDQNWPTGGSAQLIWHTMDGVIGWFRLRTDAGNPTTNPAGDANMPTITNQGDVGNLFMGVLGRQPDAGAVQAFSGIDYRNAYDSIYNSDEHKLLVRAFVAACYKAYLGRNASDTEIDNWASAGLHNILEGISTSDEAKAYAAKVPAAANGEVTPQQALDTLQKFVKSKE